MGILSGVVRNRRWVSLTLLSVVALVSLLITFRLTGVLQEPLMISETKTLEAVKWEIERPDRDWNIGKTVENSYVDYGFSVFFSTDFRFFKKFGSPFGGSDVVKMDAIANATALNGFIEGINLVLREDYTQSVVDIHFDLPDFPPVLLNETLRNLSIRDYADYNQRWWTLEGNVKAYVKLAGVNQPNSVHCSFPFLWVLQSPQNQTHQIELNIELTYFNGTAYKKVIQPFQLKLALDAGDAFETAKEIGFGEYTGWHVTADPEDFYKVWIDKGKTVKIQLSQKEPRGIILDLHLYDPLGDLVASSRSKLKDNTEEITHTINQSGWWYIQVVLDTPAAGLYVLSIEEAKPS